MCLSPHWYVAMPTDITNCSGRSLVLLLLGSSLATVLILPVATIGWLSSFPQHSLGRFLFLLGLLCHVTVPHVSQVGGVDWNHAPKRCQVLTVLGATHHKKTVLVKKLLIFSNTFTSCHSSAADTCKMSGWCILLPMHVNVVLYNLCTSWVLTG